MNSFSTQNGRQVTDIMRRCCLIHIDHEGKRQEAHMGRFHDEWLRTLGPHRVNQSGYIERKPWWSDKWLLEHRIVVEYEWMGIGRSRMNPGEVVHHIDEDKQNNHPYNLLVLSNADHLWLHKCLRRGMSHDEAIGILERNGGNVRLGVQSELECDEVRA